MTTKLYNDGINKMQTIIFDANKKRKISMR